MVIRKAVPNEPERKMMIRITIDLAPEDHRTLTAWRNQAAADLGLPVVTGADAVRAMIRAAATDPGTRGLVTDLIRRDKLAADAEAAGMAIVPCAELDALEAEVRRLREVERVAVRARTEADLRRLRREVGREVKENT